MPEIHEYIPTDMLHYWTSNSDTAATGTLWDALKAVVRGSYISCIKHYRSNWRATRSALEQSLDAASSRHIANPSSQSREVLAEAHKALQLHMVEVTKKQQLHGSTRIYEHRGKNGRLLAFLAHTDFQDSSIPAIQLADGSVVSDPLVINQEFASYYRELYVDQVISPETTFAGFFSSTGFPVLGNSQ